MNLKVVANLAATIIGTTNPSELKLPHAFTEQSLAMLSGVFVQCYCILHDLIMVESRRCLMKDFGGFVYASFTITLI